MTSYHIYGLGAALVDTEIEIHDDELARLGVDKGLMTLVDESRQHELIQALDNHLVYSKRASGGSAANTVIAASYFGARTFYSCKVADDDNGQFYLNDLRAAGVDSLFNGNREPGITGKCLVLITPDAERSMNTFLGISASLSCEDLDPTALARAQYVYAEGYLVTSPSGRAAAIEAFRQARAAGGRTALSFSDPGMVAHFRDGLGEMIGDGVDLLFCNRDEALGWAGSDDIEVAVRELRQMAAQFAITLGAEGALVFDGRELHRVAPHKVRAVDTNGAGDMFAGGYLYAISQGMSAAEAGRLGCLAAARVVSDYGPRLPGPAHAELLQAFRAA